MTLIGAKTPGEINRDRLDGTARQLRAELQRKPALVPTAVASR